MKHQPTTLLLHIFLLLALSCKEKEEVFNIFTYNGAYPRNMDGSVIKTYTPEIIGGDIDAQFNGHTWNHAPYLRVYAAEWNRGLTLGSKQELEVLIHSILTIDKVSPCILENFYFRIPLKTGIVPVNESIGAVSFTSINCDAGKDDYKLDKNKNNTINIIGYDKDTRELKAEFDVNFVIKDRNSNFGPIYPEHIHIKGKIKAVATREK